MERNFGKYIFNRSDALRSAFSVAVILICVMFACISSSASQGTQVLPEITTARPSVNGRLHTEGNMLADETGVSVQLRGVSTHGLTWYPDFINAALFKQVSEDWNCNLVRLAMYSDIYCRSDEEKQKSLALLHNGIEAAAAADMYVIVDWHILEDSDPNQHIREAEEFFASISAEYADHPNMIYEICNEPNGQTNWSDVLRYSEKIIPVIRNNDPQALILVGTPDYDRFLSGAVLRPVNDENVMYVLHFYAASHGDGLMEELDSVWSEGLPVFISECGLCESSGDGEVDFASAARWFAYLKEHQISYTVWSLSDKDETSAFFRPGFDPSGELKDADLTPTGKWVQDLIRGTDPQSIPVSDSMIESTWKRRTRSWITNSLGERGYAAVINWPVVSLISAGILMCMAFAGVLYLRKTRHTRKTYDTGSQVQSHLAEHKEKKEKRKRVLGRIALVLSSWCTLIYLGWRIVYSLPRSGPLSIICSLLLLVVEIFGFAETLAMFMNLMGIRDHPLPDIPEDAFPEVDIFIATYNEPTELLRRTVNGCRHMKYPDPEKVHIWICDDNRRPAMRKLAAEMGVGYFDRPDNKGAKAGNLNHAMSLTSAPYIVTFDADMIPKSDFLLKTIPYFVELELRNRSLPKEEQKHLGFLQTPQCFYQPDIYQYSLYSERRVPNEQDFFYRTIEPSRTSTNSVIYGGSNTVLSRKALEDAGGFFTESITEDIATGILIQSAGYVTLALPEPLASGQTPQTFREHIQQRIRWGRGVIVTLRKLRIWGRKELDLLQKISYWSSGVYWYSPLKNMVYMLSPLVFAVFGIPVFRCNWLELLVFWFPMFLMQDLNLLINSDKKISLKWSGVYETSLMPHLFIPILKESLGITLSTFKVTDKSGKVRKKTTDRRAMAPFLVLIALSLIGIVRLICIFQKGQVISFVILMFWIIRNLYFLVISVFLADGRDQDGENVKVYDAEGVVIEAEEKTGKWFYEGVTTLLTEHNLTVFLDGEEKPGIGTPVTVTIHGSQNTVELKGVVTGIRESRNRRESTQTIEILDDCGNRYEYLDILYDRIPTLPQTLSRDLGIFRYLWRNIAMRLARTGKA